MRRLARWWRGWANLLDPQRRNEHEQRDREVREKKREALDRIDRLARSLEEYDRTMRQ